MPELVFSVIVPSRGEKARLLPCLEALLRQTLARERFEVILVLDGASPTEEAAAWIERLGARVDRLEARRGPGAARNRGGALAAAEFLAFTEDDVTPAPDWLEIAASRLQREPGLDVLEGSTRKPDGKPVRQPSEHPTYLPTNLFVRRVLFLRLGGYCEDFFDPVMGIYFREDSDFGFALEESGARIEREPGAVVTHPEEHPRYLDPLRWAMRYQMDPLLQARHPDRFRERIEVRRIGPLQMRRPVVRACGAYVLALLAAAVAALAGFEGLAGGFLALAALAFLPIWAKWRFDLLRLPVYVLVPFVVSLSLLRGRARPRAAKE